MFDFLHLGEFENIAMKNKYQDFIANLFDFDKRNPKGIINLALFYPILMFSKVK